MTLIVTSVANNEVIVVADRRLTDHRGKVFTDSTYKLFTYVNGKQGYRCIVGFTGLAVLSSKSTTIDWLMRILPETMGPEQSLVDGLPALAQASTKRFGLFRTYDPTWKRTLFVLAGWQEFEKNASSSEHFLVPFIGLVGNCIGADGKTKMAVQHNFAHTLLHPNLDVKGDISRITATASNQLYKGDERAVSKYTKEWFELVRHLRSSISYKAKLRLIIDFMRLVAGEKPSRGTIGRDLLSMVMPAHGAAIGGDWHEDTTDMSLTMPHLVSAEGGIMTDFRIIPSPHSEPTSPES